jgi:hypothetical protein
MLIDKGRLTFQLPSSNYAEEYSGTYKGKGVHVKATNDGGVATIRVVIGDKVMHLQKKIVDAKVQIDLDALALFDPYVLVRGERWEGLYVEGKLVQESALILPSTLADHIPGFKALWIRKEGEERFGMALPKDIRELEEYL